MNTLHKYFKHKSLYIIVMLLIIQGYSDLFAQESYRTSKGLLVIVTIINDETVTLNSKELSISIDYESGNILMELDISDLLTESDSMQSIINNEESDLIKFEGKVGLDYINTTGHPPINFQIEGLMYPSNKRVIGSGTLVHIEKGTLSACLISLSFKLKYNEFFSNKEFNSNNDYLYINIRESLMAREND